MLPTRDQGEAGRLKVLAVTNLYPTPATPTAGTFIQQQVQGLEQIGVDVDVMVVDRINQGIKAYWALGRRVKARAGESRVDLVHVMYGGVMAQRITGAVRHRPVVVSFCGSDLLGEPRVHFRRRLMSRYGVWASHRAAELASGIIVKSENLKRALPKNVDLSKVRIIPNGVSLELFRPMDRQEARQILGWPQDRRVALFVTVRGHPRKHPELAREAIQKVGGTGRQMDFRIMQGVPHHQVPVWLNASDVLLLTSVHEGSVNVVKEAMACNLPVVSVDVGDVRERLEGVRNSAVTGATAESLAAALIEVFDAGQRSDGRDHLGDLTLTATAKRVKSLYGYAVERFNQGSLRAGPITNVPVES